MTAPPKGDAEGAAIDREVLAGLEGALGAGRVRGFVVEYLIEAERLLGEVRSAWAMRDMDGVYRPAHNLVSTAGNFGAQRVSALADVLQQAARRGDHGDIEAGLEPLADAVAEAATALRTAYGLP